MQLPSPVIALQLPLTHHPICYDGNSSMCEWRKLHRRRPSFHYSIHSRPSPITPSTSVAFFVMFQFSDLVPYIVILKMFHVKTDCSSIGCRWFCLLLLVVALSAYRD